MKSKMTRLSFIIFIVMMVAFFPSNAQTDYQSNATQTTIKGTSTLHDWEMISKTGQTRASFTLAGGQVTDITALSFTVAAESLKSDRSGLDKNGYKALNTTRYKDITFTLTSGTITSTGKNTFQVKATGNLNIAGTSKPATITATGQLNPADKSITVNGSTKFSMTGYKVKPPVVMLGAIKTGDEITIDYRLKLLTK